MLKDRTGFVRHQYKEMMPRMRRESKQSVEDDEYAREMEFTPVGFGDADWQCITAWMCRALTNPEGPTRVRIWVLNLTRELRPIQLRLACAQMGFSWEQCDRINRTLNRQLQIDGLYRLKIKLELVCRNN